MKTELPAELPDAGAAAAVGVGVGMVSDRVGEGVVCCAVVGVAVAGWADIGLPVGAVGAPVGALTVGVG